MLLKILKTTAADGQIVRAGSTVEVSDRDAFILIQLGKAVAAQEPEPVEATLSEQPTEAPKRRAGRPRKEI